MPSDEKDGCFTPEELIDYFSQKLVEDHERQLEEHLADCDRCAGLAREAYVLSGEWERWTARAHAAACALDRDSVPEQIGAVTLLQQTPLPGPSPSFRSRLADRIGALQAAPRGIGERIADALVRLTRLSVPRQALAFASVAAVVVAVLVYEGVHRSPVSGLDPASRDLRISAATRKAERPIEVFVPDVDRALAELRSWTSSRGGQLIRRRPASPGIEISLRLDARGNEALFKEFLAELRTLGGVEAPLEGFKDGQGNIVIILKPQVR